ncbi:aminotransferase class III-fold pyridoxal phosphate-dependent enzyme [Nisaea nitritireducens]|uniref:aminotransferase class III-fold pyridoxal phosphate-dependent enzyme n=1 Tax=Nisaea nitritireducens TaxID=568392 RepID=UPI0018661983|nr:aminotransferase class III-fold pyridoxal phosphate-dependent enzyme [Nisaea nitritireducens]
MTTLEIRDAAAFLHQAGSTPVDHTFVSCEGAWATDETGHRFLDFHGNSCHNIGYRHPKLIAALKEQLDTLCFTPRLFTSEPPVELAEMLAARWPYGPAKVLLGTSGADAIEMALKLAYIATGRAGTVAFDGSWHGAALGALSVGGTAAERVGLPALEDCHHAPSYWPRRRGEDPQICAQSSFDGLKRIIESNEIAALIAEPVRSTGQTAPDWFWPDVRALCDQAGTLLIFDEIPTGLGKTGRQFASEHTGIAPDMTVLGKSLGGGVLPLSAVIARAELDVASHLGIGHYTHQKNPVLARSGIETLQILDAENLVAASADKGRSALSALERMTEDVPAYETATGLGLSMAVACSNPSQLKALKDACYRLGLNTGSADGRLLTLSPPLTISEDELARATEILRQAAREVVS